MQDASKTPKQQDLVSRFYNLNLAAKANEIFEGLMSEVNRLNHIIYGLENTVSDQGEEIEAQVNVIIEQKNELAKRG